MSRTRSLPVKRALATSRLMRSSSVTHGLDAKAAACVVNDSRTTSLCWATVWFPSENQLANHRDRTEAQASTLRAPESSLFLVLMKLTKVFDLLLGQSLLWDHIKQIVIHVNAEFHPRFPNFSNPVQPNFPQFERLAKAERFLRYVHRMKRIERIVGIELSQIGGVLNYWHQ